MSTGLEIVLTNLLTKIVPYTFHRAGYHYFLRRVPAELLSHCSYPEHDFSYGSVVKPAQSLSLFPNF